MLNTGRTERIYASGLLSICIGALLLCVIGARVLRRSWNEAGDEVIVGEVTGDNGDGPWLPFDLAGRTLPAACALAPAETEGKYASSALEDSAEPGLVESGGVGGRCHWCGTVREDDAELELPDAAWSRRPCWTEGRVGNTGRHRDNLPSAEYLSGCAENDWPFPSDWRG